MITWAVNLLWFDERHPLPARAGVPLGFSGGRDHTHYLRCIIHD